MWDYNKRYLCHWNPRSKGKKGQEVTEIVLGCPKSMFGFFHNLMEIYGNLMEDWKDMEKPNKILA